MGLCGLVVLRIADYADFVVAVGVCLRAMRHKLTVYATKMCDLGRFTFCGTTWKGYATKRSSESRITRITPNQRYECHLGIHRIIFVRIAEDAKSAAIEWL